jgi:MFS family permease
MVPAVAGVGLAPTVWVAVACLALFGVGWGFFDGNNMPILSQLTKPNLRATGYGVMNLVSISVGGLADVGFGALSQNQVPIWVTFTSLAGVASVSVVLVLLIRPKDRAASPP